MNIDLKKINESKNVRVVIYGIAVLIILLGVLRVGINIGEHRAQFAGQFGDNFERNFMNPRGGIMGGQKFSGMMPNSNGATGEIISLNLPQIIITGPDNLEKTILISTSTLVRQFQQNIQSTDLKIGDFIVVLGNPNSIGQVEAKLVRVMPNPVQPFTKNK